MKLVLITLFALISVFSCSNEKTISHKKNSRLKTQSNREILLKERKKRERLENEKRIRLKIHKQKASDGKFLKLKLLSEIQNKVDNKLKTLNNEMVEAKKFVLFRTPLEKRDQIAKILNSIKQLKVASKLLENSRQQVELMNNFGFQKNPIGVLNHMKSAGYTGIFVSEHTSFDKLFSLIHPYGKYSYNLEQLITHFFLDDSERSLLHKMFEKCEITRTLEKQSDRVIYQLKSPRMNKLFSITLELVHEHWYITDIS